MTTKNITEQEELLNKLQKDAGEYLSTPNGMQLEFHLTLFKKWLESKHKQPN